MSFSEEKRESIRKYMLEKIREDDFEFFKKTSENFQISDTSVKRYIKECIDRNIIYADKAKDCGYSLVHMEEEWTFNVADGLEEDVIYYTHIAPFLVQLSVAARDIWSYVFMEIMNNAIEHSKGTDISCRLRKDYLYTELSIVDNGIGIFHNMCQNMEQTMSVKSSLLQAVTELFKGKFTTMPQSHSGEGVFFSSKMMDSFAIWSDNTIFSMHCRDKERFVQSHLIAYYTRLNEIGTLVVMKLANDTTRTAKEVFDMFAPLEEGFVKTLIPLKEVCPHGEPIARSQARRILNRLDQFKEVIFDFEGIRFMGQGFADEVFRVFQDKHPHIVLTSINAVPEVVNMIKHVTSGREDKN